MATPAQHPGLLSLGPGPLLYGRIAPAPRRGDPATPEYLRHFATVWRTGARPPLPHLHAEAATQQGGLESLLLSPTAGADAPGGLPLPGHGLAPAFAGVPQAPRPGGGAAAGAQGPGSQGGPVAASAPHGASAPVGVAASDGAPTPVAVPGPGPVPVAAPREASAPIAVPVSQSGLGPVPGSAPHGAPVSVPGNAPHRVSGSVAAPAPLVGPAPVPVPGHRGAPVPVPAPHTAPVPVPVSAPYGAPVPVPAGTMAAASPVGAPAHSGNPPAPPTPGPVPVGVPDPHPAILAAAQAGRHGEAVAVAVAWEQEALRRYGPRSQQAVHWMEVRADLARLAGEPARSCELWIAAAQARLGLSQEPGEPDVEGAVDRAHHQWEQIEDPGRARELGPALVALRERVPGRKAGALAAVQRRMRP